jgi:thiol-disulfide isomerase/thioredoxin
MSILVVKTKEDSEKYNSLQQTNNMVVMFYRDNCGHCKMFKPIFIGPFKNYMMETYPETKIVMIDVTSDGYNHIKGFGHNIDGVPTIMYFTREQANKFEYNPPGERTFDNIREFIDKIGRVEAAQSGGRHRMKTRSHRNKRSRKTTRKNHMRNKLKRLRKTNKKKRASKKK